MADEENTTTAESPGTDPAPDDKSQSLKDIEEIDDQAFKKDVEEAQEHYEREIDYILVRHMARSPRTRTMRAGRAGHRRQGVLLSDGTRIRKKGRGRLTEITLDTFDRDHTRLLEFVRIGQLEFVHPITLQPLPYEELEALVSHDLSTDSMVPQDPPLGSENPANTAPGAYKDGYVPTLEEVMAAGYSEEKAKEIVAREQSYADADAEEKVKVAEEEEARIKAAEEEARRVAEEEAKAEEARLAAEAAAAEEASSTAETTPPPDDTKVDDPKAADTVVDPPKEDRATELDKLNRSELDKMAKKLKVRRPQKLANKGAVIEAILSAEGGE